MWASARIAVAVWALSSFSGPAATAQTKEYQVKAVFLFNFTQFVEWPSAAFTSARAPIIIGVLGQNPFGSYLDEAVRGETVEGRPLEVQRYRKVDEIKTCHILFISKSEASHLAEILMALKDRSILIVGDGDGDDFVLRGGMIRLANAQNRIRLIINAEAATAASLVISSQLLRSADIVTTPKP